jgi:RNA polymerase sigma-70 factor (ECF subfamily)
MSSASEGSPVSHGAGNLTQEAVTRAKAGDSEGLHYLYVRYADDVRRFINGLVRDQHEAEDITQNVFAKLMTALDHLRAKRAIPTEEVRLTDTGRAETAQDRGRALRQALEDLPEDQREVLVLRHIVGLSPVEIADTLDKSESSVHGLHHRGRRSLRSNLTELGAAPVVGSPQVS